MRACPGNLPTTVLPALPTSQVGNTPGVTRAVQEVHLDKQVTLLDSPGVVFADAGADGAAAAALRNAVKAEQLEDPTLPVRESCTSGAAAALCVLL
jgi:nuclear GTP-binding protein